MKAVLFLCQLALLVVVGNGFLHRKKQTNVTGDDNLDLVSVKIYSNLAEIIQQLGKLPLEFSAEDWRDIRADSVTLVGTNVTVKQQTVTEKKKSLNNAEVYVRSPSSSASNKETKYVKATLIDENRNLVKLTDKDISKDPIYFTVPYDQIIHENEPPQSKFYVNFSFETSGPVEVSYLRSNLNWKTLYQLNLFDEPKTPHLIAMAEIRNDGKSKVNIEHAELLGGDINLQMYASQQSYVAEVARYYPPPPQAATASFDGPSMKHVEEVAGLYVFTIDQGFSIEGKTSHLLPMFRPQVTVDRYGLITKYFYGGAGSSTGKAQRTYCLKPDRFLSRGNCIIRESDRLVGETSLPDVAAKNKHEFSIGQDSDIVYKENVTLVSSRTYNETNRRASATPVERTESVYSVSVSIQNFKKNRPVKVVYEQQIAGQNVELKKPNTVFTQDVSKIKIELKLAAGEEKVLSYKFQVTN